jgi:hypothetical protein
MLGAAVVAFGDIGFKIEEAGELVAELQQLPLALADGAGVAGAPEEGLVGDGVVVEEGQEVDAVELCGIADAGGGEEGGEDVAGGDGAFVDLAGGDAAGPAEDKGHADAAFVVGDLFAVERGVGTGAGEDGAAVIAEENDEGIAVETMVAEAGEDGADGIIEGDGHGGEEAVLFVGDGGDAIDVALEGVEGGVDGVGGEVEEEGIGAMAIDEGEGLGGEGIG